MPMGNGNIGIEKQQTVKILCYDQSKQTYNVASYPIFRQPETTETMEK